MANKPPLTGKFPLTRMRRNRNDDWGRRLVSEARVSVDDLVWPLFVIEGTNVSEPVKSMPGVERLSIDHIVKAAGVAVDLGIPAVAIFPNTDPKLKTPDAVEAFNPDNLVCRTVRAIKEAHPGLGVICDVALDPYNADGHDGIVRGDKVLNDETVEALCRQAIVQAKAGCDIIAPSDMMDGRIKAIREALDIDGFQDVRILSYAAKYASAYYGPFRDAVGSGGVLKGDKKTYQMDPANSNEALREVAMDIAEGADMIMVKPGMPYLDIIGRIKNTFAMPTFAYQVSGEYAMIHAAAANGWLDLDGAMMESIIAFKRAGADAVFTYFAPVIAKKLNDKK